MSKYKSNEACVVCGYFAEDQVCLHHLLVKRTFPQYKDASFNLIPVCLQHHNDFHSKGTRIMAEKHKSVKDWLTMQGWTYDLFFEEWNKPDNV